jgi:signal transduction histidine kinase/CheY-like chemotaxis protein
MSAFEKMSAASLCDALPRPVIMCDDSNTIVHLNKRALALLQKPEEHIIGRRVSLDASQLQTEPVHAENIEIKTETGSIRLDAQIAVGRDAKGTPQFVMLTLHDPKQRDTDVKNLQTKLAIADRMIAVGTLAAGVAHELNNPLAYVLSNLRFATEHMERQSMHEIADLGDVIEAVKDAREGAEKMRVIVRDLKSLSRTDEEKKTMVDVRRCLESSITLAWNEIRHRARLIKDFAEVPLVETNEARLVQVFLNLIVNAAQAIEPGNIDKNAIRLETRIDNGQILVRVRDSGTGIKPEDMGRIFEAFFTTKPIGLGTGLGLAVCQRIVTGFGGQITCESKVGEGTTFTVRLPAAEAAPYVAPQIEANTMPEHRALVLVVDDDKRVGSALERVLGKHHHVVSFTRASHALEWLSEHQPDLILCDVMMPEMTGVEFFKLIVRDQLCPPEKVVFLTGGVFAQSTASFLDSVENLRLEKPFEPENIRALVRTFTKPQAA